MSSVDASATPRSAPRVVSSHQVRVDSLEPGLTTREMISARARSRCRPAGPSRAGRPRVRAVAWTAATWPCGSDPVMVTASAAGTSCWPFRPGVDQVDDAVRQGGQVGHGLVLDRAAVAVGAAQVGRGVVPAAALLVHVPGLADSDYVDLPAVSRHSQIIAMYLADPGSDTPDFLTTLRGQISPKRQLRVQYLQRVTATPD